MKRAPLRTFEHPLEARFFSGTRSWSATNSTTADPRSGRSPWESSRDLCVDLWCRPRAALHCFGATVLPLCFGNPHVLGEARRAFDHVAPGRSCRAGCRVPLGHVRYHGHDMGTQPLPDRRVSRPHPRRSSAARSLVSRGPASRSHAAGARRRRRRHPGAQQGNQKGGKSASICPVFDAKCREKDRPRRLRERLAYAHGLLRNDNGYHEGRPAGTDGLGVIAISRPSCG